MSEQSGLKCSLSLFDVTALGINGIIGQGIFLFFGLVSLGSRKMFCLMIPLIFSVVTSNRLRLCLRLDCLFIIEAFFVYWYTDYCLQ